LRYSKAGAILKSDTVQAENGAEYFAKICYDEHWWKIFNAKRRNCVKQGTSKNRNVLRRAVRRELQKLGVKLGKEFKRESGFAKKKV
jgi:hypothetical protein